MAEDGGKDSHPALGDEQRELLLMDVRLHFAYCRTYWHAIATGVELGAEEVQDQRLAAAEAPPDRDIVGEMLFVVLLFALESPIAGSLASRIQGAMQTLLQSQLRLRRRAYQQVVENANVTHADLERARAIAVSRGLKAEKRKVAADAKSSRGRLERAKVARQSADTAIRSLEQARAANAAAQGAAAQGKLNRAVLVGALRGMRNEDVPDYLVAGWKAGVQTSQQSARTVHRDSRTASPGISLRAEVEGQVLQIVQDTYFDEHLYALYIRSEVRTVSDAAAVYEDLGPLNDFDVGSVIEHNRVIAAAMIWAKLLDIEELRRFRAREQDARSRTLTSFSHDPVAPGSKSGGELFTAPGKHKKYLVARFGAVAERWARERWEDVLLPGPVVPGQQTREGVEAYVAAGHEGEKPTGVVDKFIEGLSQRTPPSDVRLDLVLQWISAVSEDMAHL